MEYQTCYIERAVEIVSYVAIHEKITGVKPLMIPSMLVGASSWAYG
jgi:hypothetical protein